MSPAHLRVDADELGLDRWCERVGVGRIVINIPTEDLRTVHFLIRIQSVAVCFHICFNLVHFKLLKLFLLCNHTDTALFGWC